jgi:thymidylate synthase
MFQVLEAATADALWLKAANWFSVDGIATRQESRGGATFEVLRAALTLEDPRQRWITSRAPALNPAFALAEVIWIVCGRNDSSFLNYFNPLLPRFAGKGPHYRGAYGYRLRTHFGIDQLERAYRVLSSAKNSRQVVLQIWDGAQDLPAEDGSAQAEDVPCNIVALLKVREGRLEWTQVIRSNDIILGLPYNIIQFSTLQEVLAGWLGIEVASYHHFADSLHLYERDAPVSNRIATRPLPRNADSIAVPKRMSEHSFADLSALAETISRAETTADQVLSSFQQLNLDPGFRNWAAVLTADSLRRRKAFSMMGSVMQVCSNTCLATMFDRWLQRNGQVP